MLASQARSQTAMESQAMSQMVLVCKVPHMVATTMALKETILKA